MHNVDQAAQAAAAAGAAEAAHPRRTRLTAGQRRELILHAATDVFATAGYRAGKVSDVAARVGVSEPVIFQNFGTKAALYAAVLDRLAHDAQAELHALIARHGSVTGLLAHILGPPPHSPPDGPVSGSGAHRTLFADAAALAADPAVAEPARRAARALAGHLADLLRRGQDAGDIRADADPEAGAWLLLSVLAARPLRAAAMPRPGHLEPDVAALALQALTPALGTSSNSPHQPGWPAEAARGPLTDGS